MTERTKLTPAEQAAVEKMADEAASAVNLSTADEMKAAIRQAVLGAFEAGKKATGWQPMETAPKDGTMVHLWLRYGNSLDYAIRTDCVFRDGIWHGFSTRSLEYVPIPDAFKPRAWMQIPEGPQDV